ncbi:MAG: substrate-binding domain-containing protein, partial [Bacteroidota bacterium]|nr:substrate-binding domain-containing protein [Bacteroidota bacterium]
LSQVEIASFHSNNVLELLVPNLSTVKIPIDEIGSMAVDMLLDNIVNPDRDKRERVLELLYQCG